MVSHCNYIPILARYYDKVIDDKGIQRASCNTVPVIVANFLNLILIITVERVRESFFMSYLLESTVPVQTREDSI